MPFAAALSTLTSTANAVAQVSAVRETFASKPDLAIAFYSPHHADDAETLAKSLFGALEPGCLIGCQGEAIAGTGREIEGEPALSVWIASFGGRATVDAFHLVAERTPDGPSLFGWPDAIVDGDAAKAVMLLLGDPYTFPASDLFLPRVNEDYPGLRVHGGMASGMTGPGQAKLIFNDELRDGGAVGAMLQGDVRVRSVVSQGCRPVGQPYVVTKAKENVIFELGGRPPVFQLRDLFQELPDSDQQLFQRGPHVGLAMNEMKERFGRDDFLVRNLYGMDPQNGAIAITDRVRVGQTMQFLVRDADSAHEDLRELLHKDNAAHSANAAGALLFSCNGRGTGLFNVSDHDAGAIQNEYGPVPVAGFFAAGELGPVGGTNFLHGFTASVVLFEE